MALPTDHARRQCTRRGLSWEMVRSVLGEPEAILPLRPGRARVVVQARRAAGAQGVVLARVFVDIVRRPPEVVTAYCTTASTRHGSPPP